MCELKKRCKYRIYGQSVSLSEELAPSSLERLHKIDQIVAVMIHDQNV